MMVYTVVIIASSDCNKLKESLQSIDTQTEPIDRLLVVPFGKSKKEIMALTRNFSKVEIVNPSRDESLACNRNKAISYLQQSPPERIAFLDDDSLLDENWHKDMKASAIRDGPYVTHATVVKSKKNPENIQSCGHILTCFRPLDLGFEQPIDKRYELSDPLFPCANSTYISWLAIKQIISLNSEVWNNNFGRLICFDLGLKLLSLGFRCKLVHNALVTHPGYLDNVTNKDKEFVKEELKNRVLLYHRFLPDHYYNFALNYLTAKVLGKWFFNGYPRSNVKGEQLKSVYENAKSEAQQAFESVNHSWKMSQSDFEEKVLGYI